MTEEGSAPESQDLKNRRILIVEDESPISMFIEDTLLDIGCQVVGCVSRLPEAVAKASELSFDVAILDVNLNGQQTFGLAADLVKRGIGVIFSTGYGRAIIPENLQNTPVLQKPFRQSELEQVLREALACR